MQTKDMYAGRVSSGALAWPGAGTLQGFPTGSSGWIGFQVDGADFTEHFVVSY